MQDILQGIKMGMISKNFSDWQGECIIAHIPENRI